LLFIAGRVSPAGEPTTDAALYTRSAALPLALAGLLLLWRGRAYYGFGILIAALLIHSLTAFYAAVVGISLWMLPAPAREWHGQSHSLFHDRSRWLPLLLFLGAATVCAKLLAGPEPMHLGGPAPFWMELQHRSNGGHVFAREWGESVWREFAI